MEHVAFDTWAWWEVLADNAMGRRLARDYLNNPDVRVFTPSLALAEMSAKLARLGLADRIATAINAMETGSEVVHLSTQGALQVGPLLLELRKAAKNASMADAVILLVARDQGAALVSNDRAYTGQTDVVRA